ncbi:carbohydrate ABC transporter permease [Enterocloster lavalensis]|uniref:carbohydrate ABC transporter permease n=1 Tax=Enterocloster lavalensis TaxID=460384 RepID=UPI000D1A5F7D|nr:carbohydrate ABC transporter permease [Enterocloster lavalensis]PST31854.1 carbohydrate ABC transporter permease [Enterocloster lavalensis]
MNSYRVKRNVKKFLFLLMVLLIIVTLMFPVAAMISVSLKKANDVFTMPVTWIPKVFAFENYVQVFRKMHILNGFKASLVITGMTIALIMVIAIPAAYAFSCLNFYCKKQMYYLVLVSQMFAPVIVIIPLYTMMNKMGLIGSWLSLVLMNTTFNLAFIVLMLKATFDGVPKEVVEAAKIDGCSPFMVMTRIFLPVSSTGIAVAVIFAFTRTWNEFLFAFTFISTTEKKPIIVSLYEILKNNPAVGIPWHYVMAGAMYTTVPLVILFICIRNYITGDHTAGAIK